MVTLDGSDFQANQPLQLAGLPCQSFCRRASSCSDSDALPWRLVIRVLGKLLLREIWKGTLESGAVREGGAGLRALSRRWVGVGVKIGDEKLGGRKVGDIKQGPG
jgi:hypothetical protein